MHVVEKIETENHQNMKKKGPEMTGGDTQSAPSIPSLK